MLYRRKFYIFTFCQIISVKHRISQMLVFMYTHYTRYIYMYNVHGCEIDSSIQKYYTRCKVRFAFYDSNSLDKKPTDESQKKAERAIVLGAITLTTNERARAILYTALYFNHGNCIPSWSAWVLFHRLLFLPRLE